VGEDARRRFDALAARAGPVLSARALAAALALGVAIAAAAFFQLATPLFEAVPALAYATSLVIAGLAVALAALVAARGVWERGPILVIVGAAAAFMLSLFAASAKLQWQRGLAGNYHYALPAHATRFPKDAQEVELRTADGVSLRGTLLGGRRPAGVVIVPGWRTNRDGFAIATLATWLANGLDVLVIDPRGQGDSGGAKSPDGADRLDVLAAVGYLRSLGHQRVGVLAEQDAAGPAILAAAERQGIDALAVVGPALRWGETLGPGWDPGTLGGRLYWRVAAGLRLAGGPPAAPLTEAVKRVAPIPLLVAGSKGDPGTAVDTLHLAAGEPKSLIVFGGEGKPVAWSHFAEYYQAVAEWLALTLGAER
jgi:hypothetical protein